MLTWLLSPLAWLLLAGALGAWAWQRRGRLRWLAVACGAVVMVALACMTPLGANTIARPLERVATPPACLDSAPSMAVVLAAGVDGRPRDATDFSVLNLASRRRMDRAIAWWREAAGRELVLVGGAPHPGVPAVAELMAAYARMLAVPSTHLRLETRSGDTWGNARDAAAMSPPLPRRIVLVTSWVHMARARGAFTSAGFETCPLPTDVRRLPSRLPWALVPRTSALANTEVALHEWVGLGYYRWRARRVAAATPVQSGTADRRQ